MGGLTRALARELGDRGITVNIVSLGAIRTEGELALYAGRQAEIDAEILSNQSIRERLTPDAIAGLFSFLASDDARYMTGQTLNIDGGWVMH